MVFSSLLFIVGFLPILLTCYYLAPPRMRNIIALIGSYFFYAWGEPIFAFVLFGSSIIDYRLSRVLGRIPNDKVTKRRVLLAVSIILNLGLLVYFKYANFFVGQINATLHFLGQDAISWKDIALPIGISFFTFQKLSYIIDLYRGIVQPAPSFLSYALYVVLFPQLIAGPIVRYHDVAQQLEKRTHSMEKFSEGIWRFSIGLGKKVLLANVMAKVVDWTFNPEINSLPMLYAWLGLFAYSFQIYFDFSGYSDMAIGLGRMMGFEFLENFNRPYIATNFTGFWRRWHISLSNWFREYLYVPLGGNQGSTLRTYVNLWIVFLCSGLWHGASWNFIIWGAFHGLFLTLDKLFYGKQRFRLPPTAERVKTFLLISFSWIFFLCETFTHMFQYLRHAFNFSTSIRIFRPWIYKESIFDHRTIATFILAFLICFILDTRHVKEYVISKWSAYYAVGLFKHVVAFLLLMLSLCSLANMDFNPFIYFRF